MSAWWAKYPRSNVAIAIPEGYFVLDVDILHNGFNSLAKLQELVGWLPDTLVITTGSGGAHYWFTTPTPIRNTVRLAGLDGLDIRGIGGYVVTAPSLHRTGEVYEISQNNEVLPAPQALIDLILKSTPSTVTSALPISDAIPQGTRDHTLMSLAGTMRRRGMSQPEIEAALLVTNSTRCNPPLPDADVCRIAASAARYLPDVSAIPNGNVLNTNVKERLNPSELGTNVTPNVTENVTPSEQIDTWISGTKGRWFETQELDNELGIKDVTGKNNRRVHLFRLEQRGIIERHLKDNKRWRFVDKQLVELDYKNLSVVKPLTVTLPLGLSLLTNLYPGNLVVFAGAPNAGKTAVALEMIKLNNGIAMPAYYFYSEGGDVELRNRLDGCEGMVIEEWNFRAFSRTADFADVIAPDCLNVVDYLEMTNDFYSVADKLTAMCNRIGNGLIVVCLQKNAGAKLGRGGSFSEEKARLYIAFDEADGANNAQAEIIKAKSWRVKGFNPNHLKTTFHIQNGWIEDNRVDWTATGGDDWKLPTKK